MFEIRFLGIYLKRDSPVKNTVHAMCLSAAKKRRDQILRCLPDSFFCFIYLLFGLLVFFCPNISQFIHLPPNYHLRGVAAGFAEKIDSIVWLFCFFFPRGLIK